MRFVFFLVIAGFAGGCSPSRAGPAAGELYVEWRGSAQGTFVAPASAELCPETGLVQLYAVRGDTGVGVLVLLVDSTRVEVLSLAVISGGGSNEVRPSSRLGLRFFDAHGVRAFEGASGTLDITAILDSALTGTLTARLQSLNTPDTLQVVGRFRDLPLEMAAPGCQRTGGPSPI
jgi:hypothetical protein